MFAEEMPTPSAPFVPLTPSLPSAPSLPSTPSLPFTPLTPSLPSAPTTLPTFIVVPSESLITSSPADENDAVLMPTPSFPAVALRDADQSFSLPEYPLSTAIS